MVSRNEILDAIKQTAKSNGGEPLGKRLFLKQTGIKESDWSGRYWSKWGDALEEAGFQPNAVPDRINESALFEKLIASIRHYKKLPTNAERRLYIKTDDPDGIESYWHRRFADRRANGEWFKLSTADVAAFKRRKFQ